ncbi:MAG: hypothetical protein ABSG52_16345 [Terriglobales bacterium]|jgi:hypothetical protein
MQLAQAMVSTITRTNSARYRQHPLLDIRNDGMPVVRDEGELVICGLRFGLSNSRTAAQT